MVIKTSGIKDVNFFIVDLELVPGNHFEQLVESAEAGTFVHQDSDGVVDGFVIITTVLDFSALVLYEAVLSYVGVGVDPSMNSFGGMINLARSEMSRDPVVWWSFTAAFLFMVALVLAANLFADGVREGFSGRQLFDTTLFWACFQLILFVDTFLFTWYFDKTDARFPGLVTSRRGPLRAVSPSFSC